MPEALDPVTQHHMNQAAERLADEFAGIFSQETIARYMSESRTCSARRSSTSSCRCSPTASPASDSGRSRRPRGS